MNKQKAEMFRWHGKNHKPLSRKRLGEISESIYRTGILPSGETMSLSMSFDLWITAIDLFMEVQRLKGKK